MQIEKHSLSKLKIPKHEVLRYLGYGKSAADKNTDKTIDECIATLEEVLSCRACFGELSVQLKKENAVDFGCFSVRSKALFKNLLGSKRAVLFTATVGIEADRLIQKYSQVAPSKAVIFQAAGAAAIEEYCDVLNREISERYEKDGWFSRLRFSPGYGDLAIECQKDIFALLDCTRKIGVTLTDGMLMMPTKSVSVIIGLSREKNDCTQKGCAVCENTDCSFRRI